jgi:hypothetical protein
MPPLVPPRTRLSFMAEVDSAWPQEPQMHDALSYPRIFIPSVSKILSYVSSFLN